MNVLTRKNYPELGEVSAPYVHAVRHHDTLYVSGLTAYGTAAQGQSLAAQAREIFSQLTLVAAAEQISLQNLIKVTLFVTSLSELAELREVLFASFGEHLPASSLVEVSALFAPDLCIEIEAILALK